MKPVVQKTNQGGGTPRNFSRSYSQIS